MDLVVLAWLVAADDPTPVSDTPASGGPGLFLPLMLVGVALMFWMMSRRNKKQQGQVNDFRNTLAVGTRVMTVGGMIGVISAIDGDIVSLKSPSGDLTAYTKRAIREAVTDDMWDAMLHPPEPLEGPDAGAQGTDPFGQENPNLDDGTAGSPR